MLGTLKRIHIAAETFSRKQDHRHDNNLTLKMVCIHQIDGVGIGRPYIFLYLSHRPEIRHRRSLHT